MPKRITPPTAIDQEAKKQAAKLEEEKKRTEECTKELQALLEKHQCSLDVRMIVAPGLIEPLLRVVPKQTTK